jgi:hypothetical protein
MHQFKLVDQHHVTGRGTLLVCESINCEHPNEIPKEEVIGNRIQVDNNIYDCIGYESFATDIMYSEFLPTFSGKMSLLVKKEPYLVGDIILDMLVVMAERKGASSERY